jgi:membrane protease YdiL (CAAX protease family)
VASVAVGLALNVFPDAATTILRGAGVEIADIPDEAIGPSGIDQLPLTVLFLVILAPLAEELMFRGLLLDWLKQKVVAWQAVLISSLIFALLHNNHLTMGVAGWIELVDRVLMGVGASVLALRGHSLRGPFVISCREQSNCVHHGRSVRSVTWHARVRVNLRERKSAAIGLWLL